MPQTQLSADLHQVVYALSDALDLVGVDDIAHGKRVGIMAAECARAADLDQAEIMFLFDLGMLHDIGVSSTRTHGHLVSEFDWESSQVHCEVGHALLSAFSPLAKFASAVRYHHTHWDQLQSLDIDSRTAERANLVYLVDRVDALAASHYGDGSLLMNVGQIRQQIADHAGSFFAPHLVDTFLKASQSEAFWLSLEPRSVQAYLHDMMARGETYIASVDELKSLARVFSQIVDAKSPFTAEHSLGVASTARYIAELMGVSSINCDKIEIAGLLHDLGKLRIPDEILEKPAPLDDCERKIMNTHSFETFQILRNIRGFEEITPWAAYHHEEPDGTGYPFHLKRDQMPLEARILRVADIFQAMVQDRPYRKGLSADQVDEFLDGLKANGKIDPEITAVLQANIINAMQAARPKTGSLIS